MNMDFKFWYKASKFEVETKSIKSTPVLNWYAFYWPWNDEGQRRLGQNLDSECKDRRNSGRYFAQCSNDSFRPFVALIFKNIYFFNAQKEAKHRRVILSIVPPGRVTRWQTTGGVYNSCFHCRYCVPLAAVLCKYWEESWYRLHCVDMLEPGAEKNSSVRVKRPAGKR